MMDQEEGQALQIIGMDPLQAEEILEKKWRQVGTDITDVDFGGNGSSGEDSEGNFIFENSSQKI